ncbi:MAG: hypothetical protein RBU37_21975 [Myxococcota bacterium]|jgi:hypothetical protein|nr:hypothetical protein [Myxococcota bacterium]
MDQETLRRVHHVLHSLINDGIARVAFLLNQNGRLLAHVGASPAFHPQARFPEMTEAEQGESVFMTGLDDRFIVGLVFADSIAMERIRDLLEAARPQLFQALAPYLPKA